MRVAIEVSVESRGTSVRSPLVVPVFFAGGDASLRAVLGDLAAGAFVFPRSPGSGDAKEPISWLGDVPAVTLGDVNALVGVGLLYVDGAADDPAVAQVQESLAAWLESAMLAHVATASGLGDLLTAFGAEAGAGSGDTSDRPHALLSGIDPLESVDLVDSGLRAGFRRFAPFREVLLGGRGGHGRVPVREPSELPAPTILAATAQAWRLADLDARKPIVVQRRLKARVSRASLTFHCTVTREG